jgi:transposase
MAMDTVPDGSFGVVGGIDTHSEFHVAVALDCLGRKLGVERFAATSESEADLVAWLVGFGPVIAVGSEGTGSYGKNLNRLMTAMGLNLIEVLRPNRQARRQNGKSDPADAEAAARSVLAGTATIVPKKVDGTADALRAIKIAHRSAKKGRTQAGNELRAFILTGPAELRDAFAKMETPKFAKVAAEWEPACDDHFRFAVCMIAKRWLGLAAEMVALAARMEQVINTSNDVPPALLEEFGVGPIVAAAIIVAIGDNPERISTESKLAALSGTSPVDASSGKQERHRLNRGGNLDFNAAIHRILIVRMRWDKTTQDYIAKRIREGKTKREAMRSVKRAIARRIFKIYRDHQTAARDPREETFDDLQIAA